MNTSQFRRQQWGQLLKGLRENTGLSQAQLGELLGLGQPAIAKLESGATQMTAEALLAAATGRRSDPANFFPDTIDAAEPQLARREAAVQQRWPAQYLPDFIPVHSTVNKHVREPVFAKVANWIPRPPSLLNVADAYAIYMVGESMVPRFRPGQLLYINPHKPAIPGYGALLFGKHGEIVVRTYLGEDEHEIRAEQYNPAQILPVKRCEITEIHTIVGLDEA